MLKKTFAALVCGFFIALFLIERDQRVHTLLGRLAAENFELLYGVTMEYEVHSINLLLPSLTLQQVVVKPKKNQAWQWKAKFFSFSCSWIDIIRTRTINLHVALDGICAESALDNTTLAIAQHVQSFLDGPPIDIPLIIKSIDLRHSALTVTDTARSLTYCLSWHSNCATVGTQFKTHVTLVDSAVRTSRGDCVHASGTVSCDVDIPTGLVTVDTHLAVQEVDNPTRIHTLAGQWHGTHGVAAYSYNGTHGVQVDCARQANGMLCATAQIDVPVTLQAAGMTPHAAMHNSQCTITAYQTPYAVQGTCTTTHPDIAYALDWVWDFTQGGTVCVRTPDAQVVARARVPAHDLTTVYLRIYEHALSRCIAFCPIALNITGDLAIRANMQGTNIIVDCMHDQGLIRIPATYSCCARSRIKAEFDYAKRTCTIQDAATDIAHGTVRCTNGHVRVHDDGSIALLDLPLQIKECPVTITNTIFVQLSGDCAVKVQEKCVPTITGTIVIDKGQMTENIMSDYVRYTIEQLQAAVHTMVTPGQELQYAMHVYTKKPMRVHTPFINTHVMLDLKMNNHQAAIPTLSGTLNVYTGQLEFPYKPLYINKATVTFVPGALTDPFIELIASNTINQYMVALQLTGTVHDHKILLESSPSLTDAQIIALLFVGSQDSLTSVLPTVLAQNMAALLLADTTQAHGIDRYLKGVFHPLERVRLVPRFSDQTARGGLRGALEVNVDDRWRALIQNNFSLTEDTRVELEYQVSDDIRVRGIRNERHDVAGEVEMRWKF